MSSHREVEATYAPDPDAEVPDLTTLHRVSEARGESSVELSAVYFDTADLRLVRAGVSLRRRTGGSDEGWHLKVPAGGARDEIHRPLGRESAEPPEELRDLVLGWTHAMPLDPVATVITDRAPTLLVGGDGEVLAEFTDDRVEGTTPSGGGASWREWELELVHGDDELLDEADRRLADAGVGRAEESRKVVRVLGDRVPPQPRLRQPKAGKATSRLVQARLVGQVRKLGRQDVEVRRGTDEGIHKMRVSARRIRALLATFRPTLDRDRTDPIRDELRWLVGVLGEARDSTVVFEQLRDLIEEQPPSLVPGPVVERLRSTYDGRGKPELRTALASSRYFALRERLDELAADPPWTELADAPVREVAPRLLKKELKRFRKRTRVAASSDDPTAPLHEVRKAAKRMRYAAEAMEPVGGKPLRRLERDARRVTSLLGELQDTAVSRGELFALAEGASTAGESSLGYGRLHALQEVRAQELIAQYSQWDALDVLKSRIHDARHAFG
jgi:CHAD domain-containing protein